VNAEPMNPYKLLEDLSKRQPVTKRLANQRDSMPGKVNQTEEARGDKPRKKLALGRGLDALLPVLKDEDDRFKGYFQCDVALIRPNRYQPRQRFSDAELEELSRSIREKGILQPLIVRKSEGFYELVAGERRLRAAKLAGLEQVPVVIKEVSDSDLLEVSIIENIQREDLNPIEESEAYHRLIEEFGLTQENLAGRIGKSRSSVANFLRLRQLPEQVKASILAGDLSMGHARALLGADTSAQQTAAWREVVLRGLSVRQTEALVKRIKSKRKKTPAKTLESEKTYFSDLAQKLSQRLGTKVKIQRRGKRGRIEIEFYADEDLDRLLVLLKACDR